MPKCLPRLVLGVSILAAAMTGLAAPAYAQSSYDGLWSVLIITDKGTCDRGYRYAVRINKGNVGHADPSSSSFNIRGKVKPSGGVCVSVVRGDKRADGCGRMTRDSAAGKWRSAKGECSGMWTAERRGG